MPASKLSATRALVYLGAFCQRRALWVIGTALVLSVCAVLVVMQRLSINTDTGTLLDPDLPWQQDNAALDKAFPQNVGLLAIVIDGQTPELAESAAVQLTKALAAEPSLFRTVRRPDGGPFFDQNGILFLSLKEVQQTANDIIAAQPLIGGLAADPTLRGLFGVLNLALQGVQMGQAERSQMQPAFTRMAATIDANLTSEHVVQPLSWQSLLSTAPPSPRALRRFVLAQPVLDYGALEPGAKATGFVRATAEKLHLTPDYGVTVRQTGNIPLNDDQFASVSEGIGLSTTVSVVLVLGLLLLALRSFTMTAAIMVTLFVGLLMTAAFAALAVGALNLISVAFAVLFVGIAVDFGVQLCIAVRAKRTTAPNLFAATNAAIRRVGAALVLAALSAASGFFAFLPTDYRGVSELGLIAGVGMLIAVVLNLTLLPALLAVLPVRAEPREVGWTELAPVDRFLLKYRRWVLAGGAVLALGSLALMPRLSFDFNPLNLVDPHSEAASTMLELMRDPLTTPNTIDILTPSVEAAAALTPKLQALPEVDTVLSLNSFVPGDQEAKLAVLSDLALLVGPVLDTPMVEDKPSDAALRATAVKIAATLRQIAPEADSPERRLADGLNRLAKADAATMARVSQALLGGLPTMLDRLRLLLSAQPVTLADLPKDLKETWVSPDGQAKLTVFPKGNAADNAVMERFVDAVRAVAPHATGTAVTIQESSRTIVGAFITAGILATVMIALLLAVALRRLRDVLLALTPLLLAGLLTLAATIVTGLPINFANIIALPLLLGVGVAFDIYFVVNWRARRGEPLQSSTTRAIVFSALTTGSAFGALWLSPHPGTAGMGELLTIELLFTLFAVLVFMPALLGPPVPLPRHPSAKP
ncbi:MMPL family transporter [Inquilinus sp. Marseille-Q2685]|uniref:MMPL family transporter n=1 Tax=Inquilinus sp. Marseille-Q2685 TaxID=2866581 RepID=UPI001CE4B5FB|nr:MMPL family transporter [Inquilinus sp. Marseille-Q2685]